MAVLTPPASLNDHSVGFHLICKGVRGDFCYSRTPPTILQVYFVVMSYSQMEDGEFELREADAGGHLCFA